MLTMQTATVPFGRLLHVSAQVLRAQLEGMDHLRILAGLEQAESTTIFFDFLRKNQMAQVKHTLALWFNVVQWYDVYATKPSIAHHSFHAI